MPAPLLEYQASSRQAAGQQQEARRAKLGKVPPLQLSRIADPCHLMRGLPAPLTADVQSLGDGVLSQLF
jgi:hypothetical protein